LSKYKKTRQQYLLIKKTKPIEMMNIKTSIITPTGNRSATGLFCAGAGWQGYGNQNNRNVYNFNGETGSDIFTAKINRAIEKIWAFMPPGSPNGIVVRNRFDILVLPDVNGFTPLHYVAAARNVELAEELVFIFRQVERHDFLVCQDKQGRTPLHWAVESGSLEIVKLLVECGVPLNIQDYDGFAPIHRAIAAINRATLQNQVQVCRETLKYLVSRVDLNVTDINGVTALHLAAEFGDIESINELIQAGAWINVTDHQGENALFYAVRECQSAVITTLVEDYDINMEMPNEDQENILDLCKSIGDSTISDLVSSLFNTRINNSKINALKETNGMKNSTQNSGILASNSGYIRFSGHSCA